MRCLPIRRKAMTYVDPHGARALTAALIEGAMRDLKAGGDAGARAEAWVAGGRAVVSFETACDVCGLDPAAVLPRLRGMAR